MDTETTQQLLATAERLASAAETLDRVLEKLDAQHAALNAKVDRIAAAVEERGSDVSDYTEEANWPRRLKDRIAELEKANSDLKGQAARLTRKTLSPLVTALLSKSSVEAGEKLDAGLLDKTLQTLSVEQRIAVKAEMARAGMIE
jgi:predicted RNase H-like nuclease (RuvC/YqgF family)